MKVKLFRDSDYLLLHKNAEREVEIFSFEDLMEIPEVLIKNQEVKGFDANYLLEPPYSFTINPWDKVVSINDVIMQPTFV